MKKFIKRFFIGILLLIVAFIVLLIINNLINRAIYLSVSSKSDSLSEDELQRVYEVYEYLDANGREIMPGFDGKNLDLVIFNSSYEFLICDNASDSEWKLLSYDDILKKNIYRKEADNPQAFTVYTNYRWVGSMSTKNYMAKTLISGMDDMGLFGFLIPPQAFILDDEHYKGTIIHEMLHALQAFYLEERLVKNQNMHNISGDYESSNQYLELMKEEAKYIELSMNAESREQAAEYAKQFLTVRKQRRDECNMSAMNIHTEIEFEWMEGLARYAEYKSSSNSKSMIYRNLTNIKNKISEGGDEKFYALGMAQALVLDKIMPNWKSEVYHESFTLEGALEQALK